MRRLLLAYCLAPLLPALVHALIADSDYHPLAVFVVAAIVIYVLLLAIGMPGHLLLRRSNRCGAPAYLLLGLFTGAALALALSIYACPRLDCAPVAIVPVYWALLGAATTAIFWFVLRPDRRRARPAVNVDGE